MKKIKSDIHRRGAFCMFVIMVLFLIAVLRVSTVSGDSALAEKAAEQSLVRLRVSRQRGTIFDTNLEPLTNDKTMTVTAVTPLETAVSRICPILGEEQKTVLLERASEGIPTLVKTGQSVTGEGLYNVTVAVNQSSDTLAPHLLGYTDSTGHGVCGVQKAFDKSLYSGSTVDFCYTRDGKGEIIDEFGCEVKFKEGVELGGVKLTIDADIQAAAETVADSLKRGAIVISEVGSGKIRALVSRPDYDPTNVAEYLNDPASPLLNRAFCAYNVGSAFKPCVAAAALESGAVTNRLFECVGSLMIEEKSFACHRTSGHGPLDLRLALAYSCNTYFYSLALDVGAKPIYNMASSLGFGQRHYFADSLFTERGFLPSPDELFSPRSLANLAIGQGDLMLSPVSMLTLYESIAGGGVYYKPSICEGYVDGGVVYETERPLPTRVMSEQTAATIKNALMDVIKKGTGVSAAPKKCTAAGKTATAQTGWLDGERKVEHSWFCGFFPAEDPQYVAVILSEDTNGGGTACSPLFSRLADAIFDLKLS